MNEYEIGKDMSYIMQEINDLMQRVQYLENAQQHKAFNDKFDEKEEYKKLTEKKKVKKEVPKEVVEEETEETPQEKEVNEENELDLSEEDLAELEKLSK